MREIKLITRENIPCWYEFSWRSEQGVILRIHEDFANDYSSIKLNPKMLEYMKKNSPSGVFSVTLGEDFGEDGALKYLGQDGKFLEYQARIVLCRKLAGDCPSCSGTGKGREWEAHCFRCYGEGKGYFYDYSEAKPISRSLGFLLEQLKFPENEVKTNFPQLLLLNVLSDGNRFGVSGEFSIPLVEHLRSRESGSIPEMVKAMIFASEKMEGRSPDRIDRNQFRAETTPEGTGWLNVSCPSQACGIHPHHNFSGRSGEGYQFYDHNVDQPMQQMMLIASIAALHDLARKFME